VGIARAVAMQRPILCLDEAFSALDVLTAETLRRELLRLWTSGQLGAKSLIMVTHNISEAASLGKRIFILGSNPGTIRVVIKNDLPYPRDEKSAGFKSLVDNIHDVITESVIPDTPEWVPPALANSSSVESLPPVPLTEVVGLMEVVSSQGGRADSFQLSHTLGKEFGNILFLAKAAEILDFVDTPKNFIVLTELGRQYVNGDPNRRKQIVHEAMRKLRICQLVEEQLRGSENLTLSKTVVLNVIHEWLPNENAEVTLSTLIQWGRYGELFGFNADTDEVYLDVGQENV
jgi:NitT/TauT family transport system ATP-binding protein